MDALDTAPGDTALMLRRVEMLLRTMEAEHRLLGGDRTRFARNLEVVLSRFGDLIVPPDR